MRPRLRAFATDEHALRAQDVDEVRDRTSERGPGIPVDRAGALVAYARECSETIDTVIGREDARRPPFANKRWVRDQRFEAAMLPALAERSVLDRDDVAELTGSTICAAIHLAADDDP